MAKRPVKKRRKQYTAEKKHAIVREYHARKEQGQEVKAMLDREGIASSMLQNWVRQAAKGKLVDRRTLSKNRPPAPTQPAKPAPAKPPKSTPDASLSGLLGELIEQNTALRKGLISIIALAKDAGRAK